MTEESYTIDADEASEQERKVELERARDADALNWVLADQRGRRVLWNIMASAQVFHEGFSDNPIISARNLGRRSIGLEILHSIMETSPATFVTMTNEGQAR